MWFYKLGHMEPFKIKIKIGTWYAHANPKIDTLDNYLYISFMDYIFSNV